MKQTLSDLAIFGGTPAFQRKLYVGGPNIPSRERLLARLNTILDNRWLTNDGPFVHELEARIAEAVGVKHCVCMCNATVGLEIVIRALGFTGEVIVPAFTFIATAHALQWQGITPVFCDADPRTHNIDPARIEELITPRTTGIIGVHLWGRACDIDALSAIAKKHNLKLMFDAAHAFFCSHGGKMIGGFGNAEVFSFHATKFFNTFEGGAVVTNDDDLAEKMRLMRNFGFADYDKVIYIGTNGKMSEISAAMGLASLEEIDNVVTTNRRNYKLYREGLAGLPGVQLIQYNENERCNFQYMVVEVEETESRLSRNQLVSILHAENVIARKYFYPGCHRMEPYRSYYPHARHLLPQTERLADRVMALPTGTSVQPQDVQRICEVVRLAVTRGGEAAARLAGESVTAGAKSPATRSPK